MVDGRKLPATSVLQTPDQELEELPQRHARSHPPMHDDREEEAAVDRRRAAQNRVPGNDKRFAIPQVTNLVTVKPDRDVEP